MTFRRQPLDRVNPRYVPPSRHTIFIRGLPGSTNVDTVKNHFTEESKAKCTVEFFSTSEDKVRFSVAIRFKSHETAREMIDRYNGKELLGYPVEVTWFKDLRKARAQVYEDQRHGRFRNARGGFRGSFRGFPERRGRVFSPYRVRDRSFSGEGPPGRRMNSRPSASSRSTSRSASRSVSPKRRRLNRDLRNTSAQGDESIARIPRRRFKKSSSASSSRSRSSSHTMSNGSLANRNKGDQRSSFSGRDHGVPATNQGVNSPANTHSNFLNAPAPCNTNDNSGLLSGLIHLQSKRIQSQPSQPIESSHSNSASSRSSSRSPTPKRHQRAKHNSPLSSGLFTRESKSPSPEKEVKQPCATRSNWRPISYSEENNPTATDSLFAAYGGKQTGIGKIILSPLANYNSEKGAVEVDVCKSNGSSPRLLNDSPPIIEKPINKLQTKSWEEFVDRREKTGSEKSSASLVKDRQTIVQERKMAIEEEYKKDCETFATVVRTLISKDSELEERLLPLLKKILNERGQRCIEDLRAYIEGSENNEGSTKAA